VRARGERGGENRGEKRKGGEKKKGGKGEDPYGLVHTHMFEILKNTLIIEQMLAVVVR